MVIKARTFLIALLLASAGLFAFFALPPSEEKRIKRELNALAQALSKETGESLFTLDQKLKKIGSLLEETCELSIQAYSISGTLAREEILGYVARSRLQVAELQVSFYDIHMTFPQRNEAKVTLTARLTGKMAGGEAFSEAHEIDCLLKKSEKRWLFVRAEVVEVLKK
ncbi:MAG: hypothetical protein N3G78_09405 [Desulfobacterota bacterium]|nr:hypothetical protein [Thermodesulfobacteriota bacterium]